MIHGESLLYLAALFNDGACIHGVERFEEFAASGNVARNAGRQISFCYFLFLFISHVRTIFAGLVPCIPREGSAKVSGRGLP